MLIFEILHTKNKTITDTKYESKMEEVNIQNMYISFQSQSLNAKNILQKEKKNFITKKFKIKCLK